MDFIANNIYIVLFLPIWVILVLLLNLMTDFVENKRLTSFLTMASTFVGLCFSIGLLFYFYYDKGTSVEDNSLWFSTGNTNLYFGYLVDKISSLFLFVLMFVSLLVQLYSHGYMAKDANYTRYYMYLNFFNFSMAGLIISSNLIQTYLFWELVGVSSYLLIGFWVKKYSASKAAIKAFIVNRVGDTALLMGIIMLIYLSVNYLQASGGDLLEYSNMQNISEMIYSYTTNQVYVIIGVLLLIGAIAKSAQFPLHVWLSDAMEAPTPISALIHAATMVAAGIFLVVRLYPYFMLSSTLLNLILVVGVVTALMASFIALTQNDLKRMLAFSTSSQLGLMFVALGIMAPAAALYHFASHAIYKALLFLAAGCIISTFGGVQDMRRMGGLRKKRPILTILYIVGAFSLAGLLFSGFSSKEAIYSAIQSKNNIVLSVLFLTTSLMTAFYIFKSYFLIFEGEQRSDVSLSKVPKSMYYSSLILALFTVLFVLFDSNKFEMFIDPLGYKIQEYKNYFWLSIAILVPIISVLASYFIVSKNYYNNFLPKFIYNLSYNKFYIDRFYLFLVRVIFNSFCKVLEFIDLYIIDGLVRLFALITRGFSWIVTKMQSGNVQTYISYSIFMIGAILLSVVGFYYWLFKG